MAGGLCFVGGVHAQYLRTSYFIEGSSARLQLNPALQPARGFVNVPVLNFFAGASSNVLGITDIIKMLDSGQDVFPNDDLYNRLKDYTRFNVRANTDILSFGWYKGKGLWTASVRLRTDVSSSIPKSMFEYLRNISNLEIGSRSVNYASRSATFQRSISDMEFDITSYAELGVGYSRPIDDKLTVGGRFNLLLGLVHTDVEVNNFTVNIEIPDDISQAYSYATSESNVKTSMKGGGLTFSEVNGSSGNTVRQISGYNFDMGGLGIAGTGVGIDLGATYKVLDNLTVSAALLDLGFIRWRSGVTTVASSDENAKVEINENNYLNYLSRDFMDLKRFNMLEDKDAAAAYTTKLSSTFLVAGEYALMNNKLSLGAMYSAYFVQPKTLNELTLSATIHPKSWCDASLSYSPVQAKGKSFGVALKLGPVFFGTDYVYFGNNTSASNFYFGVSFPIGKKRPDSI